MKKIISLVTTIVIVAGLSVPSLAISEEKMLENRLYEMQDVILTVDDDSDVKIHVLTEEEAIEYYQKSYGMTREEAARQVALLRYDGYQQVEFKVEKDFGAGYTVEAGALVKCYAQGSFFSFEEVIDKWTKETSTGDYSFDEAYIQATISSNKQKLTVQARGVCEVALQVSQQDTVGVELLGAGFSHGSVTGTTVYYRKIDTWAKSWTRTA